MTFFGRQTKLGFACSHVQSCWQRILVNNAYFILEFAEVCTVFWGLGLFTCTICKHNKYSELLSQYLELKKISLVLCVPGTDRIVDHLLKYSRAKNHISALKKVAQFPRTLCWEMTRENPNFLTAANCGGANDCTEPQCVKIIFGSVFLSDAPISPKRFDLWNVHITLLKLRYCEKAKNLSMVNWTE